MIRKILVATDGSAVANEAVRFAVDLVQSLAGGAELHLVSVVDYADVPPALSKAPADAPDLLAGEAAEALELAYLIASEAGAPSIITTLRGHVTSALLEYAHANGIDLIVVGTHGRRGIPRALLGSTCDGLVRSSDIPVVSVRSRQPA
jgi:nucleotide-binding universal stress UspA family protein